MYCIVGNCNGCPEIIERVGDNSFQADFALRKALENPKDYTNLHVEFVPLWLLNW